jgi:hypothetical protein
VGGHTTDKLSVRRAGRWHDARESRSISPRELEEVSVPVMLPDVRERLANLAAAPVAMTRGVFCVPF